MSEDDDTSEDAGPDLRAGVAASDLPEGAVLAGTVAGEAVLLARVGATCTHLGGPLGEGVLARGEVRCPWHHARFALATGEAVGAPAFAPLSCFAVEERGGHLFVTSRRPRPERPRPAAEPPERVVILGGGAAGHACAEMLARAGLGGRVTVLTDDPDPPYDRTFLSKQYLIGMAGREECALDGAGIYGAGGASDGAVRLVRGRAAALDLDRREVVAEDGARHGFDALVIATGSEPKRPEGPGLDGPGVFVLRTLADADAIIAAAEAGRRAAVLGASFVGLEVAASLRQRDVEVEVVAPDEVPLERVVGAEVGRMIRGVHEEQGVRFRLGRTATGFDGRRLALDDGSAVEADLVVAGIGVAPRTALAREAGPRPAHRRARPRADPARPGGHPRRAPRPPRPPTLRAARAPVGRRPRAGARGTPARRACREGRAGPHRPLLRDRVDARPRPRDGPPRRGRHPRDRKRHPARALRSAPPGPRRGPARARRLRRSGGSRLACAWGPTMTRGRRALTETLWPRRRP